VVVVTGREVTEREDVLDSLRCREAVAAALQEAGHEVRLFDVTPEHLTEEGCLSLRAELLSLRPKCVFNLFEGFSADSAAEIRFCTILEELGLPFTGNPSATLARCLDKAEAKELLRRAGLPVAPGFCVRSGWNGAMPSLKFPLFCKPRCEDGSVGIGDDALVQTPEQLVDVLSRMLVAFPGGVLVEEFLPGREFNVGFLGNVRYTLLGVSVIDYEGCGDVPPFLNYASKWDPENPSYAIEVRVEEGIPPSLRKRICSIAAKAGKVLGCRGYFRVDLRERDGKLHVLEVNPNPDLGPESGLARQGAFRGYSYSEVVSHLVHLAGKRVPGREERGRRDRCPARDGRQDWRLYTPGA
jgi:D-alanine-D-alanine ligase